MTISACCGADLVQEAPGSGDLSTVCAACGNRAVAHEKTLERRLVEPLLVELRSKDGEVMLLTIGESILYDKVRDGWTPWIPSSKFFMVEEALERLGKLTAQHRANEE